tara:strand:+ start:3943 stop:7404 length:3462 start_codon:yes stop_codon:yes gene_type:complete
VAIDLWEDLLEQQRFYESETIRKAYTGLLEGQQRQELENALSEKYNLDIGQLRPEDDPIYADIEGGRTSIINKMLGLGAEINAPLREEEVVDTVPSFAPTGGVPNVLTDIDLKKGELKGLVDQYTLNEQKYLEQIGVDTGGIPPNVDDTGARAVDDPQLLLSRLPPDADQTFAARKAITQRIQQELPDFTEDQLKLYRDELTDVLIFDNPLNNNQPTTVPTMNQGNGQAVLDWFRKEGPELAVLLTTGIAGTVGGLKMQDVRPGGVPAKLAQNLIGPITGGALADSGGQFIWDFANMVNLRDKGLLDSADWDNKRIAREAGKNAGKTGGFSLGSAAFFNAVLKAMGVKGVWAGDFDEKALHSAVKKGLASESESVDPAGKGFWDKGSALSFIKRVMDADELPDTMKDAFPKIGWSDKYFGMGSEEAMSIARNIVAHKTGDNTILLGKTLPQMIKMAQEKGLLTAEDSVAVGSIQDLQTMLHVLRDKGNEQARKMIDDVLRPQELYLMEQYSDNLYKATGININALREGGGQKFYQSFGELIDKELGSGYGKRLAMFSNNIDNLNTEIDKTISVLGRGEIDDITAGATMKEDVIAPLFKQATDEKDAAYAALFKEAGGKMKNKDITSVIDDIKGWEKTRGRQWGPRKTKISSDVNDFINSMKASPQTRKGAFKLQSFDDIQGALVNARALRDEATKSADRAAMDDMIKFLEKFRTKVFKDIGKDTAAKAEKAEDLFAGLQDNFNKGIIKKIMASSNDAGVITQLLSGSSRADAAIVRKAIFDNPAPEAEKAISIVQGAVKGRLINLGRELPEEAGTLGRFNKDLMKDADFAKFYRENEAVIREFFDKDEAKMFLSLPRTMKKLNEEVVANQKFINNLRGNKKLKELGLTFDDVDGAKITTEPEWFFNRIWTEQGGIGGISRVEKFVDNIPTNKAGNKILKDLKIMVGSNLDDAITIPDSVVGGAVKTQFKGGMIDPMKLKTYLKTHGDSLDAIYGKEFRKGLEHYQKMLKYFMPEGGTGQTSMAAGNQELLQQFTGRSQEAVKMANGLTRAYIGIFTRPGRFLTAGLGAVERAQEKKVLDLVLHPDKFMNTYQMRRFLESPLVNTVIRNWGRPVFQKDTSLEEDVAMNTQFVETKKQYKNLGGRVTLMPLEYNL